MWHKNWNLCSVFLFLDCIVSPFLNANILKNPAELHFFGNDSIKFHMNQWHWVSVHEDRSWDLTLLNGKHLNSINYTCAFVITTFPSYDKPKCPMWKRSIPLLSVSTDTQTSMETQIQTILHQTSSWFTAKHPPLSWCFINMPRKKGEKHQRWTLQQSAITQLVLDNFSLMRSSAGRWRGAAKSLKNHIFPFITSSHSKTISSYYPRSRGSTVL